MLVNIEAVIDADYSPNLHSLKTELKIVKKCQSELNGIAIYYQLQEGPTERYVCYKLPASGLNKPR